MAPVFSTLALALPALAMAAALPSPQRGQNKIVGGEPAEEGEFPYIISLQRFGGHYCGGSLLNENTVLTAKHCIAGASADEYKVRAGTLTWAEGGEIVDVSEIIEFPGETDAGILKLATPITGASNGTSAISFATLPEEGQDPQDGTAVVYAGWGATSEGGEGSDELLKVQVPVISREECRELYGDSTPVRDDEWCAVIEGGGKDACQGDSGGPVVDSETGAVVGLVSWGIGCARPDNPGVNARVGSIISWINENLGEKRRVRRNRY